MFGQYFGDYLLKNNLISSERLDKVMEYQERNRAKLGLIAVSEGLLTAVQAEELNHLQATQDKRFGDLAIEKGYLTENDISHLLRLQGNPYLVFIQALEENNIMTKEEAEVILANFQKERHFSNSDLSSIKNGELEALIPVFLNKNEELYNSLIGLALRNIVRFVTSNFRMEYSEQVQKYSAKYIAYQRTEGDHEGFLGFACDDDTILKIANGYAREIFKQVDDDSMDSICEFINCINGLYATQLSHENVDVNMLPPEYSTDSAVLTADEIIIVPLYMCHKRIDLIVCIDAHIQVEL